MIKRSMCYHVHLWVMIQVAVSSEEDRESLEPMLSLPSDLQIESKEFCENI